MRRAILASKYPVWAIAHAIARGVCHSGFCDLDLQLQLGSGAAAEFSSPGGIRAKLMSLQEQGEADLSHFDAAEFNTTSRLPLACGRPAIAHWRSPATAASVKHMPDEGSIGTRIHALDGDAEAPGPAGKCAVRTGRSQRLDYRFGDLLGAVIGGQGDGSWREGPDHCSLLELHGDRPESPLVLRNARIDEVSEGHMDGRHGIRVGGIDEANHLWVRIGEIDDQRVPVFGDHSVDLDVADTMAVIVQNGFTLVYPILPGLDTRSCLAFGTIQDLPYRFGQHLLAIFVDQVQEPPFSEPGRANHGAQVAQEVARMAHVGG